MEIETPVGPARADVRRPAGPPKGTLVLGHGAGGGFAAADLRAAARDALAAGWIVVLVEQPWKVAGRKVAAPPGQLDTAWTAVVHELARRDVLAGPLVLGGRSAGARVACRTAATLGATAVCCLAFPLHPPGKPERSRAEELAGVAVPALVVQGRRDAFGSPDEVLAALDAAQPHVRVVAVDGDHGLKAEPATVGSALVAWLGGLSAG